MEKFLTFIAKIAKIKKNPTVHTSRIWLGKR